MAKVSPLQEDFSTGEISPYFKGRVSSEKYKQALDTCKNYIPLIQGGLTRRPGTKYIADVKTASKSTRLIPFEYSTTQAYIIEFGDLYLRFYRNQGQITSGGPAYEIVSPYAEADLFQLKFTQSADVLYITHPSYAPRKLNRYSNTSFTLTAIDFLDGPYLKTNATAENPLTAYTLTPAAATGDAIAVVTGPSLAVTGAVNNGAGLIRITTAASTAITGDRALVAGVTGTVEANGTWVLTRISSTVFDLQASVFVNAFVGAGTILPGIFVSTDVGRLVRMQEGTVWGWGKIATFTDCAHVAVDIKSTLTDATSKPSWRLGEWGTTTGYPSTVVFHEDRLVFATNQRIDGSMSSDYENFAPTDTTSAVLANSAISFSLNDNKVNVIRWMTSDEKGLLVGTAGGEWLVRPSSQSEAMTAVNISAKPSTYFGSANIQPVQVGKASLFIQTAGRKCREVSYFFDVDGFRAPDLSYLSEHITGTGVLQLAYQKEPQSIVWMVRADGVLIGMTYERELENLRVGWHRHELGGTSDASGTIAKVESVAVIPSSDGKRSEVWIVVKRWINGATKRYVESLTQMFEDNIAQREAFFVDCGLTYDDPKTITAVSIGAITTVTSAAHGFSNGDRLYLNLFLGIPQLEGLRFYAANVAANTFEIQATLGVNLNSAAYTAYVSGGKARKLVSTISGLTHLEGQTVSIWADGAVLPDQVVTAGAITITEPSSTIQIGYGYNSDGKMLRLEAGSQDGTALGKTRRIHRVGFLLHRSLGLKYGASFTALDLIPFRSASALLSAPVPLFSGIKSETLNADYDFDNQICWRVDQPTPSTILAVMPQVVTQDRG